MRHAGSHHTILYDMPVTTSNKARQSPHHVRHDVSHHSTKKAWCQPPRDVLLLKPQPISRSHRRIRTRPSASARRCCRADAGGGSRWRWSWARSPEARPGRTSPGTPPSGARRTRARTCRRTARGCRCRRTPRAVLAGTPWRWGAPPGTLPPPAWLNELCPWNGYMGERLKQVRLF